MKYYREYGSYIDMSLLYATQMAINDAKDSGYKQLAFNGDQSDYEIEVTNSCYNPQTERFHVVVLLKFPRKVEKIVERSDDGREICR